MIADTSFTKQWILAKRKEYRGADPGLIEKQIYAFEVLHLLIRGGKEFVFKGGTSLHLILPEHRRLSTDLDIVGAVDQEELSRLITNSRFSRVEEDIRKQSKIPKRHFKFFYVSVIDGRETYVLLDTLEEGHTFPELERRPIRSPLFETDEEVSVSIPSLEGILGDKLTVFAPHTVGIPFGAGKSMEIIKQLFDIGELFNHCRDVGTLIGAYNATQALESKYREPKHSRIASLQDTIQTGFLVAQYFLKGSQSNAETAEIALGLRQMENHLLGVPFKIEEARVAASRSALLASIVLGGDPTIDVQEMRYTSSRDEVLSAIELPGPYAVLNRLKKLQQLEAFHYWARMAQM